MKNKSIFSMIKKSALALTLVVALGAVGIPANTVSVSAAQMTIDPAEYPFDSTIPAVYYDKTVKLPGTTTLDPEHWTAYTTIKDIKALINQGKGKYSSTDNSSNASKGTITPDMCTIYPASTMYYMAAGGTLTGYAKYGTNIGSKSEENEKVAEGEYVLAITKGSDTISYRFSVKPVKRIDWPTSLPNTEYLAGIDWDLGDTSFKVTYTNGATSTIPVTKSMLYLAETGATVPGGSSTDGTVIGAQSVGYGPNMINNAGYYTLVIQWNGYNSASKYSNNWDKFSLGLFTGGTYHFWPDNNTTRVPAFTTYTAQEWYKYAYGNGRTDRDTIISLLNQRNGEVDGMKQGLMYQYDEAFSTERRIYTTYVIDSNGPRHYLVTVYVPSAYKPELKYRAHVQNIGWQGYFYSPEKAGTDHQSLRMEALQFGIENYKAAFGNIDCTVHVQNKGDMKDFKLGEVCGTTGLGLRMEGISLKFTDQYAEKYTVSYRVHLQGIGWTTWYSDGEFAGTKNEQRRMEAIEIQVDLK